MAEIKGMAALQNELRWLAGGFEGTMSHEINELGYEGAEKMYELMAHDTGYMKSTLFQTDGFMFTSFGTKGTDYAAFTDGMERIYDKITPFFYPTVDFLDENVDKMLSKVISEKSVM